ncbi:MAG TPA: glycoside hydrolase family protein [Polyangiaceae bacterium]|nr:glycoside hydrolase family protein [Polyangiaceae bacterium]
MAILMSAGVFACACSSNPSAAGPSGNSAAGGGAAANGGSDSNANGGSDRGSGGNGAPAASAGSGTGENSRAACKRGLAYGHHSVADLKALSAGVSWWYNWDFRPDQDLRSGAYLDAKVEYAPMIWGAASDRAAAKAAIGSDARVLLGFNEPNFGSQANLSAKAAAALWPELTAIADEKGLRLVSPAVNFCGGNCQDTDPFHYLDEFFAACTGCRVDAVAIHIYVGCTPSGKNKAEYLINHVETYKKRFSQPLWLTEFACDSAKTDAEQQAFLQDAVAYLEAEPRIERYAWFSGRATNVPHVDLLGASGELTALGKAYVTAPQNPGCAL